MGKKAAQRRRREGGSRGDASTVAPAPPKRAVRWRPPPVPVALVVCFFLSGTASLILEVAWTRMLRLVFGSTTLAVSTILVAYMLGLGIGGLGGGRLAPRLRRGVATYGWMEIGIGLYALLVPFVIDLFPALHRELLPSLRFWPSALLRFVLTLLVLMPGTVLMGATLPILVAALARQPGHVGSRVGLLYGTNTLGAVAGVLGTTFVLFPILGVFRSSALAAGLDLVVGAVAVFVLTPRHTREVGPATTIALAPPAAAPRGSTAALIAYGVVGFTALAYEVCWTRALAMILGSSVYAFATMLAAFLTGISLGSLFGRRWFDRLRQPFAAYALGIGALGLCSLFTVAAFRALPDLFVATFLRFGSTPGGVTATNVVLSMLVMLAPTLVLGALFPLLVAALSASGRDPSASVGDVYFANTIGSASGAFAAGFVLIPTLGLAQTIGLAVAANLATASILLASRNSRLRGQFVFAGAAAAAAVVAVIAAPRWWSPEELTRGVFRSPGSEIDVGLRPQPLDGVPADGILLYREGINTTVSVHRDRGQVVLRVNGKTDASSQKDMGTQVLAGHIPLLFGPPAQRVLIIGLASGVTVGSAALHDLERIDVVELEPAIVEASHFFDEVNGHPLERPEVHVIADDGRNLLASTRERYDVIISEPSNPWITGASSLFTREFFAQVRRALEPGGRLLQWVQLYGLQAEALRSVLASLEAEFPYVYGFSPPDTTTDLLLLATDTPIGLDHLPRWERLSPAVRDDLQRVGVFSTAHLWALLRLTPKAIDAIASQAEGLNTDDNLFVELRAPWALYRGADANLEVIRQHQDGVLPVAESAGDEVDATLIRDLALIHLQAPSGADLGEALLRQAAARGDAAARRAAEAREAGVDESATLDRILDTDPAAVEPRLERARARIDANDLNLGLADADAALALRPGDVRARALRLEALNGLVRFDEARSEAEALHTSGLAQRHPEIWLESAKAAAGTGQMENSLAELRFYLQRVPADSSAWFLLSRYAELAGDRDLAAQAKGNYERSTRNLAVAEHAEALRALRLGERERAMRLLQSAMQLDPSYGAAEIDLRRLRER